jgi:hypothetical protein
LPLLLQNPLKLSEADHIKYTGGLVGPPAI